MKQHTAPSLPGKRTARRSLIPISILLLVSLACSIPSLGQGSTTVPAAQPSATAQSALIPTISIPQPGQQPTAGSQQPLPPGLVEVDPLPESEIIPGQAPVFYFNQPMEKASVESAFQVQPPQNGRFEWVNDSTVRYVPSGQSGAAVGLDVTIAASAKAANGLALPAPVIVRYPAAAGLRVIERLPAPGAKDANPSSAIAVTFNRPMVALGADAQGLPPAFSIDPTPTGRAEWLNTSTYIFYPDPPLLGGATYTVKLNTSLTSTDGVALVSDSALEWSFSTAAPKLLSVTPKSEQPVPLDSSFTLTFNQPMDTASVEADFSLLGADNSLVEGTFAWNDTATELTFKPKALLGRGTTYSLLLLGSARSQGGAQMGENFAAVLSTVPQFAVTRTTPAAGEALSSYSGYSSIVINFSSPVAPGQDLRSLIKVEPAVLNPYMNRSADGEQIFISGYFQPGTSYSLSVDANLKDRWGAALGTHFSMTFSTTQASPTLTISARQLGTPALFVPQNETVLPANVTNLTRLDLKRGKVPLNDFLRSEQEGSTAINWQSMIDEDWSVPLSQPPNTNQRIDIPLSPNNTPLEAGLYFLKIDSQPDYSAGSNTPPVVLVVSPVQMVVKVSNRQAFVWVVRVENNTPVTGQKVTFYDNTAAPLASCVTDPEGKCRTDMPPQTEDYKTYFAVTGQPGQPDFGLTASNWNQGVAPWDFRVMYVNKGDQPEIYLYTDRPIYRPGQAVNFRLVARSQQNGRYAAPPMSQVTVEVYSPYDSITGQNQVLAALPLQLDAFGAAAGSWTLPKDARPGSYLLRVKDQNYKEIFFQVAEYRKPEIDLQVSFTQPNELTGKDVQAKVNARYFFGAPAGNLPVHWTLTRSTDWLNLPDNLTAGLQDFSWLQPDMYLGSGVGLYVMDGTAQTGPDGTLTLTIPGADLREKLGDAASQVLSLQLEVTVEDESGLPVSARNIMRLNPSPFYIGVAPETWVGNAGQELTYTVRSVDWSGKPVGDKALSARFRKVNWQYQESPDGMAPPQSIPQYIDIGSTDFRTSDRGDARLAFIPMDPGTYMLEVTGESGAITQQLIWVSGPSAAPWPTLPNQRLRLQSDRGSALGSNMQPGNYKPGENARIFIPNPYPDGALALVTVERGNVMGSMVMPIQGASYELSLPITTEYAPNIYVSVVLLGRANGRPDFRMGYIELAVDPSALLLNVSVETSPQQPQPGGDLTLTIRAKDQDGKPVQGSFSLALVDKAVLALADPNSQPIVDAFYARQPLGVQSSLSLVAYAGRYVYAPPGRGGGGGDMQVANTLRTKFEDTAYWNGSIQTDVTGIAQVKLTLPDNLTTWRADVRGLTEDTRVGQATADLVVSKPLLVSPVVPRFTVAGDHLELAAMVFNNTANALHASVRLEAVGFTFDDLNQAVQPVDLQPGDRRRVSWWGTVQNVDGLDLTFSAESDAQADGAPLRDATRPERNPLPVLRYTAPQTFGTSGLLAEAGERTELVSLPRSFTPTGGQLNLEISPSLTATVLQGLKALDAYPYDFTEPVVSRLLPNLAAYQALHELNMQDPALNSAMQSAITDGVARLSRLQNEDGGWAWTTGYKSDPYISACVLLGLSRAAKSGAIVDPQVLQKAQDYLQATFVEPAPQTENWLLDRLAFRFFVLQDSGRTDLNLGPFYEYRDKLSPWGKAFLAMAMYGQNPDDERARTLVSDLQASASRSATGANWQDPNPGWRSWSSSTFTTAVVAYAIARVDPASPVLMDAMRYLILNRHPDGAWSSSFDTSWALLALIETARGTGDLQANYSYTAKLNETPMASGQVAGAAQAVTPVLSNQPLNSLRADAPNALVIQRGEGAGRLFYRAFLRVDRPAEDAPAIQRGLMINRQYYLAGQDCRKTDCKPLGEVDLSNPQPVQVRLTLTVPEDMHYVVVEDAVPAGTEVLNPRLKISQQAVVPSETPEEGDKPLPYTPENPFEKGWGAWYFNDPQVTDDHVRWVVDFLPAGTYELTYRLTPYLAGEFRVLPARAWQYYFPEVEGASKGEILVIR